MKEKLVLYNQKIVELFISNPLTIFSIYICTYFIYSDFSVRMFIGYGLLFLILSLVASNIIFNNDKDISLNKIKLISKSKLSYIILSISILLFIIRPDSKHDSATLVYLILMIVSVGYLLIFNANSKDVKNMRLIFIITSILFSIYIIFFQIYPDLFWQYIFPVLSDVSKEYAENFAFRGYSVPIGSSFTYMSYIIVMGIFCLLPSVFIEKKIKLEIRYIFLILVLLLSLILIGRRGELLSLLITLALFYILSGDYDVIKRRLLYTVISLIVLIILVIVFLPQLSKIESLRRYTNTIKYILYGTEIKGGVTSGRDILYSESWRIFKLHPIFGVGWGSFSEHMDPLLRLTFRTPDMEVHNFILQLLAETGIVGFVFIFSPILYNYYGSLKSFIITWSKSSDKVNVKLTTISISFMFQTFILVVSMLDPSTYKIIFWPLYVTSIILMNISVDKNLY